MRLEHLGNGDRGYCEEEDYRHRMIRDRVQGWEWRSHNQVLCPLSSTQDTPEIRQALWMEAWECLALYWPHKSSPSPTVPQDDSASGLCCLGESAVTALSPCVCVHSTCLQTLISHQTAIPLWNAAPGLPYDVKRPVAGMTDIWSINSDKSWCSL